MIKQHPKPVYVDIIPMIKDKQVYCIDYSNFYHGLILDKYSVSHFCLYTRQRNIMSSLMLH